ncbi:hypothetical protein B0T20DRAFT_477375 [Sordaria brevicollis]|uniref:Increased rDNA silencing protein 4 n=1 Tax=Sordaria brevicollis TaxID=83679 RepID=A0AAE0PJQ0_SORBR|nr:hypothetical protein B0T20DRAFT_477375 [Sordaria brevicollis]
MPASVASSDGRGPASSTSSLTGASANPATSGLAAALKGATLAFQHQQKTTAAAAKGSEHHTTVPRTTLGGSSRALTPGTTPVSAATSRTVGGTNGAFLAANIAAREHSPPTATSTASKKEASRVATTASSSNHSSVGSSGRTNRQEQANGQATNSGSSQRAQHVETRSENDHAPSKRPKMHSRRPSLASVSTQATGNVNSHPPTPTTSTPRSGPEPKAASWIAATLAASRSGTPSPSPSMSSMNQQTNPALSQQHVRSGGRTRSSSVATSTLDAPSPPAVESHHPDTASIPIFDGKHEEAEPVKKKKKKKSPPVSRAEYHQTITSPSPTPSESHSMERRSGTGGESAALVPGKTKLAPKPKPKPRRMSLSTVGSIASAPGTMEREGESSIIQGQSETRYHNEGVRGKASSEGRTQTTGTGAKDIQASVGTSGRERQQKTSPPATPRSVQSKQGVEAEVPTKNKRPSTPPVPQQQQQHVQISETKIVSPQPRRVVSTPRLESSPAALPKPSKSVTSPRLDNNSNNKPTIRKSSRVVSSSMDQQGQSQTTRQSVAAETVSLGDRRLSQNSTSSDETFVSASSSPSPRPQSPVAAAKVEPERERAPTRPRLDRTNTGTTSSRAASRVGTPASVRSPVSQTPSRPSPILRPETGLHSYSTGASPTPEMSLDSLTNAMIASNLASSRLAALTQSSSLDSPPPIPPPRRSRHHHHHPHLRHHTQSPPHASPLIPQRTADNHHSQSQPTSLLKTLRAPRSLSDDEDLRLRRHKKHLGVGIPSNKKKHAHNEGARRRWRDEMTLRQRKRYEAVWASNRGLFLRPDFAFEHPDNWHPPTPPDGEPSEEIRQVDLARAWDGPEADLVVNIVVRDIWSRSRLPVDELAEVWDLVDRKKTGALDKQEFVVGMWLIDQRLKGRKIPTVVGEGVWESARDRVVSVNVKAPKSKHGHGHGHHHHHGHHVKGRGKGHVKGVF